MAWWKQGSGCRGGPTHRDVIRTWYHRQMHESNKPPTTGPKRSRFQNQSLQISLRAYSWPFDSSFFFLFFEKKGLNSPQLAELSH